MKIDTLMSAAAPAKIAAQARELEQLGFDCVWTFEATSDAFLPLAHAAAATRRFCVKMLPGFRSPCAVSRWTNASRARDAVANSRIGAKPSAVPRGVECTRTSQSRALGPAPCRS